MLCFVSFSLFLTIDAINGLRHSLQAFPYNMAAAEYDEFGNYIGGALLDDDDASEEDEEDEEVEDDKEDHTFALLTYFASIIPRQGRQSVSFWRNFWPTRDSHKPFYPAFTTS